MSAWIASVFALVLEKLATWLFQKGLEAKHGRDQQVATDADIDQKLATFKEAYKETFNGEPVTPEQRKKLNQAIADFIRGPGTGGL